MTHETQDHAEPAGVTRPANAWLVYADAQAMPAPGQPVEWSVARQTQAGDLVFGYVVQQRAVRFVARAATAAWHEGDDFPSRGQLRATSWWVRLTAPVPVSPIAFPTVQHALGGHVSMRGRSGRYVSPGAVERLSAAISRATPPSTGLTAVLQPVTAPETLPTPGSMDLDQWRSLPAGPLRVEQSVKTHVAEPLLHWALSPHHGMSLSERYPLGRKEADYVVLRHGVPSCVVQVKVRMREGRDGAWRPAADVRQAIDFGLALDCGVVLVDTHAVCLIGRGADTPFHSFPRSAATTRDLEILGRHLAGRGPQACLTSSPPARVLAHA